MKKFINTLFVLLPMLAVAQSFQDNFSDGNFTTNPTWTEVDSGYFTVNGSFQLQSNGPAQTDTAIIYSLVGTKDSTVWEFYVKMDFDPSTSNQARIYLSSNQPSFNTPFQGYFIQIGASGSTDDLELRKQSGSSSTTLINNAGSTMGTQPAEARVRVTRGNSGNWELFADFTGGTSFVSQGTVTDNTYPVGSYIGIMCRYTSSNPAKFFFDDFSVSPTFVDTDAPEIVQAVAESPTQLDVFFNEAVDQTTAEQESNYSVNNGIGSPSSAVRDGSNSSLVHLTFSNSFSEGTSYTLTVNGVEDPSGNTVINKTTTFQYKPLQPYDVIINEIMADEDGPVGVLPEEEYVELHNRTDVAISLVGWTFFDSGSTTYDITGGTIPANGYIILCHPDNMAAFASYGNVATMSSFPSLTNGGETLILRDKNGDVMDYVLYDDDWYGDAIKADGGWSLELIDPNNPCGTATNWRASNAAEGGTPGAENSVFGINVDDVAPSALRAVVWNDQSLSIFFDESVDRGIAADITNYVIDNGLNVTSATPVEPDFKEVVLGLSSSIQANTVYTLTISNVSDCAGNAVGVNNTVRFGLPELPVKGDVIINEILFNPRTGGSDFVELYNTSGKVIDLKHFFIAEADNVYEDSITEFGYITTTGFQMLPGDHAVLTAVPSNIQKNYYVPNPGLLVEVDGMPGYNDDEGVVVLTDTLANVMEMVHYTDDWHTPLLDDDDGVSLERISYGNPGQDESNWHSAAAAVGYATPTYRNSQFGDAVAGNSEITIEPEVFSPDGDGYKDFVSILYKFDQIGYMATIKIYDDRGRLIKNLVENEELGVEGSLKWDGATDEGEKAKIGIYIVFAEIFDLEGNRTRIKETCVLAGKL